MEQKPREANGFRKGWLIGSLVVAVSAFGCGGRAPADPVDPGASGGATGAPGGTNGIGDGTNGIGDGTNGVAGGASDSGLGTNGSSGARASTDGVASVSTGGTASVSTGGTGGVATGTTGSGVVTSTTSTGGVTIGGIGTSAGSAGYCEAGAWTFKAGQVIPRDCNECTCNDDGSLSCTEKACSCVDRPLRGLSDAFSSGTLASNDLPTCLPTCGASPPSPEDSVGSVDGLPNGTCDHFTNACVMSAHAGCACPDERGPVAQYVCSCQPDFTWGCSVVSMGADTCANACLVDGGTSAASCALTNQLSLTPIAWHDADGDGNIMPGEEITLTVQLLNQGPADHDAYPGIELSMSLAGMPTSGVLARNAAYSIAAGMSQSLDVKTVIPASAAICSVAVLTVRARSFGESEAGCEGISVDVPVAISDGSGCPSCGNGVVCGIPGSKCQPSPSSICKCDGKAWVCAINPG
jgi:hypothetical protein